MRFGLRSLLYSVALAASGMAALGAWGIATAAGVLAMWAGMHRYGPQYGRARAAAVMLIPILLVASFVPDPLLTRGEGRMGQCRNNLHRLAMAIQLYASHHGALPPACTYADDGTPMNSWRVLILPYIDQQQLYDQYDFAEPWNGPTNSALATQMPNLFQCPSDSSRTGTTNYFAIVGPTTAWPPDRGRKPEEITDGAEQTLLLVEAHGRGVNWLDPRDIPFDEALSLLTTQNGTRAGSVHSYTDRFALPHLVRNVTMIDRTSVHAPIGWSSSTAEALLTVAGNEDVRPWVSRQVRAVYRRPGVWSVCVFILLSYLPLAWVARSSQPPAGTQVCS